MVEFGLLSSVFDFLTFGVLLCVFHAAPDVFRTGWFVESLLTELVVALVVRTRRPFFRSRPGRVLLWTTLGLVPLTLLIAYLPGAELFGFVPLEPSLLASVAGVVALYVGTTELVKQRYGLDFGARRASVRAVRSVAPGRRTAAVPAPHSERDSR